MTTLKFYKKASTYLCGKDKKLAKIIKQHELSPLELHEDYFRELTESIIGQQLSVKAADTILKRFYLLITGPITPEKVIRLNDEKIRKAGISYQKISYIKDLAKKFQDGEIEFKKFSKLTDEEIIEELVRVRGIGRWTAEMFLIFGLGRPDVFSFGDLGLRRAIEKVHGIKELGETDAMKISETWKPYRSVASRYLWKSLDNKG